MSSGAGDVPPWAALEFGGKFERRAASCRFCSIRVQPLRHDVPTMTVFEHVTALFSFVYALALTHVLVRIGELIVVRERVRASSLLFIGMANAILTVFGNWLSLWDLRSIQTWELTSITVQFAFAVGVFLLCVFVSPPVPKEGTIGLDQWFWCQRPAFYATAVAIALLALIANLDYLKTANAALFFKENALVLGFLVVNVIGFVSRKRALQYVAGFGFLAANVSYLLMFCRELK